MHTPIMRMLSAAAAAGALAGLALVTAGAIPAIAVRPAADAHAARAPAAHPRAPFGRVWNSLAYDPAQRNVVMFGGDTGRDSGSQGLALGTTWTWNGRWTERHPASSPSARTGAAVVYDSATRQLLLFGGSTSAESGFCGDTWSWTGRTWHRLHPATSPPARHNADMVYDAAARDVVLFGGYDGSYLGDTWTWNGTTWKLLRPADSPSPRDTDTLTYDPANRAAILYGGFNDDSGRLGDTWSWTGSNWTQLQPAANPGPRSYGAMTYDPALREALLIGGSTQAADPTGIWKWNGKTWQL